MDDSDIPPDEDVTTWREVLEDYRPNQNDDDDEEWETGGGQSSAGALSCHLEWRDEDVTYFDQV